MFSARFNEEPGDDTNYADIIVFLARQLAPVRYLELGMHLGKTLLQLAHDHDIRRATPVDVAPVVGEFDRVGILFGVEMVGVSTALTTEMAPLDENSLRARDEWWPQGLPLEEQWKWHDRPQSVQWRRTPGSAAFAALFHADMRDRTACWDKIADHAPPGGFNLIFSDGDHEFDSVVVRLLPAIGPVIQRTFSIHPQNHAVYVHTEVVFPSLPNELLTSACCVLRYPSLALLCRRLIKSMGSSLPCFLPCCCR